MVVHTPNAVVVAHRAGPQGHDDGGLGEEPQRREIVALEVERDFITDRGIALSALGIGSVVRMLGPMRLARKTRCVTRHQIRHHAQCRARTHPGKCLKVITNACDIGSGDPLPDWQDRACDRECQEAPRTNKENGEAWRIRTSDSLLKRQELYRAELTPHALILQ